jgi:probable HAF family extracellular repeat protein
LWQGGVMTDLIPVPQHSSANAVNDAGQVVGNYNLNRPFLWEDGVLTDLGGFFGGPSFGYALDINHAGQVVGSSASGVITEGIGQHAFLWEDGVMTDLGVLPGMEDSRAHAINGLGQVVGFSSIFDPETTDEVSRSFLYAGGVMTDLGVPGTYSAAEDINDAGQVVGWMAGGVSRAYLYEGGVVTDLNTLVPIGSGLTLSVATGINNAGQIVGYAFGGGRYHAFLLTPVAPVPGPEVVVWFGATELLDGTGLAGFGGTLLGAPVTHAFTVRNAGSETLTLSGPITLPAGFSLASGFSATALAPGGQATFAVRLAATAVGNFGGTVSFGTSDPDEDPFSFTVSGAVGRVIDDGASGFSSTGFSLLSGQGHQGDVRRAAAGSGGAAATWTFGGLPAGAYRVSATWTAGSNRATNAPFTVRDGSTALRTVAVNQRQAPNDFSAHGAAWEDLGTFTIGSGSLVVRLTNQANGWVIADAIRIEPLAGGGASVAGVAGPGDLAVIRAAMSKPEVAAKPWEDTLIAADPQVTRKPVPPGPEVGVGVPEATAGEPFSVAPAGRHVADDRFALVLTSWGTLGNADG